MLVRLRYRYRDWGKLAAELLIVTVGVALGLWANEWSSNRKAENEVRDAKVALERELSENLIAVRARRAVEPCVRSRIAELRAWIARQRAGERVPLPNEFGRPGRRAILTSVWAVTKAGQVAAKMTLEDRLRYANAYDMLSTFAELQLNERDVWFAIGDYAGIASLSPTDLSRLQGLITRAATFDESLGFNYPLINAHLANLGITNAGPLSEGLQAARRGICQPLAEPESRTQAEAPKAR